MFNILFYQPVLNLFVWLANIFKGDFGWAIVVLTILTRIILFPIFQKALKNQQLMVKIQPEMERIQKEYKDDKEKQTKELLELYKKHNLNPFSSFFLIFAQLPIIAALYKVILALTNGAISAGLYSFVSLPATSNYFFLNLINLKERNNIMFGLVLIAQLIQGLLSAPGGLFGKISPEQRRARQTQINTNLAICGLVALFLWKLPAAMALYWLVTTIFSAGQQILVNNLIERDAKSKGNN